MNLYVGLKFKTKFDPNIIGEIVEIVNNDIFFYWKSINEPEDYDYIMNRLNINQVIDNFEYWGWYKISKLEELLL